MILSTHGIAGAAIARLFPEHPAVGFVLGMASHYLLDAVPHWQYQLLSLSKDSSSALHLSKKAGLVTRDALNIGLDILAGLAIVATFFWKPHHTLEAAVLLGAGFFGGLLPDGLQVLGALFPSRASSWFQKFHDTVGNGKHLVDGASGKFALISQIGIIVLISAISLSLSP